MSQPSAVLRALDAANFLPTPPSSAPDRLTCAQIALALLSDRERRKLATARSRAIPPVKAPRLRPTAHDSPTRVLMFDKRSYKMLFQNAQRPYYVFLDPPQFGFVWLGQEHNKLALEDPAIGLDKSDELERYLDGKWRTVGWETLMPVRPNEPLLLRFKGVSELADWESVRHLRL
ncbi:hypothetical protein R3P38DRAFT_3195996 [Favolaschia claudopus]|uniref:Uncharacterized protein n=1 Tax=Favolaschia claudopus TaxID=2862362 RepID=A0AAW0AL80_9AGAR